MYRETQNRLFSKSNIVVILEAHLKNVQEKVDKIPRDQFMASSDDDVFEYIKSDMFVNAIVIYEDSQVASSEEIQIAGAFTIYKLAAKNSWH